MLGISGCLILCKIGTEKTQRVVRTALSAHLLRGVDRLLEHILHHVFVDLRSLFFYFNAGSYLQLVLNRFNCADDAKSGEYYSIIANESRNVIKFDITTIWEGTFYQHSLRLGKSALQLMNGGLSPTNLGCALLVQPSLCFMLRKR